MEICTQKHTKHNKNKHKIKIQNMYMYVHKNKNLTEKIIRKKNKEYDYLYKKTHNKQVIYENMYLKIHI